VGRYRDRIGPLLDAYQFDVGAIRETRQRHLGYMVRVRTAVLGGNTSGRAEGLAHFVKPRARKSDVIDFQLG
jgi:hypothetical protein